MDLELLFQAAATYMGMPDLEYTEDQTLEISLPDGLEIVVEPSRIEDAVHVYSLIGMLLESGKDEVIKSLLKAQLYHSEMGEGCCFGLDEESDEIYLNRKISLNGLEEETFIAALNEFASWASHWRDRVQNNQFASPSYSTATDIMPEMHYFRA